MGKRYYCEYCDKTMVSSPAIIKTHNKGIVHQKIVQDHYQQYKDPATILSEEQNKKPCSRYRSGTCQFGSICRFSHYLPEQIQELRQLVETSKSKTLPQPDISDIHRKLQEYQQPNQINETNKTTNNTESIMFLPNGESQILPWTYNSMYDNLELPPSLKRIKVEDFKDAIVSEWG